MTVAVSQYEGDVVDEWPAWKRYVYHRYRGLGSEEAAQAAGFSGSPSEKAREAWKEARRTKPRSESRLRKEKARLKRERRELEAELERTKARLDVIEPKLEASRRGELASEI